MFRVEHNVPDVYVNDSRDFQLFSRLYDLVFQSSRFSIDSLEQVSDTMRCNDALLPLIATKVGFFTDLRLTSKADRQVLSAFPYIINYKGSLEGIQLVANLFGRIVNTEVYVLTDPDDKSRITISFDDYISDIELLTALLEYIRPTGVSIDFEVKHNLTIPKQYVSSSDRVTIRTMSNQEESVALSEIAQVTADGNNPDLVSNVGFTQIVQVDEHSEEKM